MVGLPEFGVSLGTTEDGKQVRITKNWYQTLAQLFQSATGDYSGSAGTMPGNFTANPEPDVRHTKAEVKSWLAIAQSDVSGLTAALATLTSDKAGKPQSWEQSWTFIAPEAQDYRMVVSSVVARTITSVTTRCAAGTATLTVKINSTALGGSTNSITTSQQTRPHSSANVMVAGDDIVFTFSSVSSTIDRVTVTLGGTLNLA